MVELCSGTLRNIETYGAITKEVIAVEMVKELTDKYPKTWKQTTGTSLRPLNTGDLMVWPETKVTKHNMKI